MLIDLRSLPGPLRNYLAEQEGEWIRFDHKYAGRSLFVHAGAAISLWQAAPTLDVCDVFLRILPPLCAQCGLVLEEDEKLLCAPCVREEFEQMIVR